MFRPIASFGLTSSTRDRRAARFTSASTDVTIPGAMAPPMNSPRPLTQLKVVAVPKSITISGGPYFAVAAKASTYRSAPTSRGASTASGIRVFTPGSMKNGGRPKYFSHIHSSVCWTGGTTLEIDTPWMSAARIPRECRNVSMKSPYSSAVCSRRLVRRHETSRRCPSNTPIFVLVLPTSATSSMSFSPRHRFGAREPASSGASSPAITRLTVPPTSIRSAPSTSRSTARPVTPSTVT